MATEKDFMASRTQQLKIKFLLFDSLVEEDKIRRGGWSSRKLP